MPLFVPRKTSAPRPALGKAPCSHEAFPRATVYPHQLVFHISLFYQFGVKDYRLEWGKRAGDKWLIRAFIGTVVPVTASTSEVPRCCRSLVLHVRTSWSSAYLCWMTFEDKSKIRAQNTASFPQCTVSVSSSETYWTRQVSVWLVTLSRVLVQSPLESCKFG